MSKQEATGAAGIGPGGENKGTNGGDLVEHPGWCDRSLCTAPERRPTREDMAGLLGPTAEHCSTPVRLQTLTVRDGELRAMLRQTVCPWETEVQLIVTTPGEWLPVVRMGPAGMVGLLDLLQLAIGGER